MRAVRAVSILSFALAASVAPAASYLPVSDADLAARAAYIVRGRVVRQATRAETIGRQSLPFTLTTIEVLESLKGGLSGTVTLRLPGGRVGDQAWSVPGTPTFTAGQEVVLLARPAEGHPGEIHLTEFGLSRFDLVRDESGRLFAVRPAFDPEVDVYLARRAVVMREPPPSGRRSPLREGDSFLAAMRSAGAGESVPEIAYSEPKGATVDLAAPAVQREWVNIGGREPVSLFRWFWDTGNSPNAVVAVTGTQSLLSDSSNGMTHVQNGVDQWHTGVPSTDIRVSGVQGSGNVTVALDAASDYAGGTTWSTPLPCGSGGVLGLGGPGQSSGPRTYKGESPYFSPQGGNVSLRVRTGAAGCYDAATFRTAVMHELGHVLCLGHPDQAQSTHSATTSADWATAVMTSSVPANKPSTPQTDDIQGMQYYYGVGNLCFPSPTTLCLNNGRFKLTTSWTSSTASGQGTAVAMTADTGYFWFFSSTNVEMVVKVLGACVINSHYWVFAGGLTNTAVTLTVTDMQTGAVKPYTTTLGPAFPPIQDTSAFSTCP